jgi:hypothetical protein
MRWHRQGFRTYWTWKSRRQGLGRPLIAAQAGCSAACRSRVAASTHRSSPFGPSCATFPVRRALPFLPFRASVPIEWTDCSRLLCPLLTSAPRSENLSVPPAPGGARRRSPEVRSTAFDAQPPNLRCAPLVDTGFAVVGPLARRGAPLSGSCPSARTVSLRASFRPRLATAALALRAPFTSTRLGRALSPPHGRSCSAHQEGQPLSAAHSQDKTMAAPGTTENCFGRPPAATARATLPPER